MNKNPSPVSSPAADIFGVTLLPLPLLDVIEFILIVCRQQQKVVITNINIHAANLAYELPWFRAFLNQSARVFCDGFGVKWAAGFLYGCRLVRYTPPDWFPALAEACAHQELTLYFLGAKPGVAQKAAGVLSSRIPKLQIIGTHDGYFEKSPQSPEQQAIIAEINRLQPDILVVGFGMPLQERWIMDHWDHLQAHVALPVGAFFDYMAGEIFRPPRWMTDHGLEWLGRLLIEPHRLWKRYLVGNLLFIFRIVLYRLGIIKIN